MDIDRGARTPGSGPRGDPGAPDHNLQRLVAAAAIAGPLLHSLTDVLEWWQRGFSDLQLWLNYVAFLPMPWLLLGIWAVHRPALGAAALAGAVLHGVAFTYFAHTTLLALAEHVPDYEVLWQRLGAAYTLHGAIMVAGGLVFAAAVLRERRMPRWTAGLYAAGLLVNAALAVLPAPDLMQTLGTAIRNAGLVGMGVALWPRVA